MPLRTAPRCGADELAGATAQFLQPPYPAAPRIDARHVLTNFNGRDADMYLWIMGNPGIDRVIPGNGSDSALRFAVAW